MAERAATRDTLLEHFPRTNELDFDIQCSCAAIFAATIDYGVTHRAEEANRLAWAQHVADLLWTR